MLYRKRKGNGMYSLTNRRDILNFANGVRFYLRHYAKGYYPVACFEPGALPVNRMFFPLRNPNGKENCIRSKK